MTAVLPSQAKKQDQNYVTAKEAGKLVGYAPDYITRLAREKKIDATQRGRQWFVDPESVKLFALEAEAHKRERSEQLRESRKHERLEVLREAQDEALTSRIDLGRNTAIAETAVVAACLFLFFNLVWFSLESKLNLDAFVAGVGSIGDRVSALVIEPIPAFLHQVASVAFVDEFDRDEGGEVEEGVQIDTTPSDKESFQGVVVFEEVQQSEDRLQEIRESFSDEVEVEFDGDDTGVVTPIFREREGDDYRFLLVPVNQADR